MAIMIPSTISPEIKSNAEKRIFNMFKDAPDTDSWIVLHSLGISNHDTQIFGETDFFVLAPELGLFALEIKGGRISRQNGMWHFTNKYGQTNTKSRGPFEQAKEGVYSIVEALKTRLNEEEKFLSQIFFGYGVMLPDIEYEASGIDEEQWQVFDIRNGNNIREFVIQLAAQWRKKWEEKYGRLAAARLPRESDIRLTANKLRGDFDIAISMIALLRQTEHMQIKLTEEQYRCLDQLDDNPRCVIQGAAGTGKTLLALEEVKRHVAADRSVALFCFNSKLAKWLKAYFEAFPANLRPSYVGTLHSFMTEVLRRHKVNFSRPSEEYEKNDFFSIELPRLVKTIQLGADEKFDKVVIDEAQDLITEEYMQVLDRFTRKGIQRGKWTLFGDFGMQAIYSDGASSETMFGLLENLSSFARFRLTINCRNSKPICEEIATVTGFTPTRSNWSIIEGRPVDYISYSDETDQSLKLGELLQSMLDNNVQPCDITILSSRKRDDSVVRHIRQFHITDFSVKYNDTLTFCTIHSFKGLENKIIVLTDIDDYSDSKLMYVAFSRARSGLWILHSERANNQYLELFRRRLSRG